MKILIKKEAVSDSRVSVTPKIAKKFIEGGHELYVETLAGHAAGFDDSDYTSEGCHIFSGKGLSDFEMVLSVNALDHSTIKKLKPETIVVSLQRPHFDNANLEELRDAGVTSFALDLIPRTSRAQYMDVLSSQASLAGYRAVLEGSTLLNRALPLMMTTAGTIPAAKVLIIGAGVAGLQAIATAKRLGAAVSAFDVRRAAKEQVESLGAKFVEVETKSDSQDGVYASEVSEEYKKAQEQKLRDVIKSQDLIITTAQIFGRNAPIIIKKDMIDLMKKDSVIIDLASETGGNTDLTKHGETVEHNGVRIVSFENIASLISYDASNLFAKNTLAFVIHLGNILKESGDFMNTDDDIVKSTMLTYSNKIVNPLFVTKE